MSELYENLDAGADRRAFLRNCGKFAATVPPAMTVLLSTSMVSPAIAQSSGTQRPPNSYCNNGVGNGPDCTPPGNPFDNDTGGAGPGNPNAGGGNKGGNKGGKKS